MADERRSPSGGWCEVYREMAVEAAVETDPAPRCPDCGRPGERVAGDVYRCDHRECDGPDRHDCDRHGSDDRDRSDDDRCNCDRYWRSE